MENSINATYVYLRDKYKISVLSREECARELNMSLSEFSACTKSGIGIPKYRRSSSAKNAKYFFNIYDIAIFLNSEKIQTM